MQNVYESTFSDAIKAVKFNSRRVIVLTESIIYIYNSATMRSLHIIKTVPNPDGIIALSNGDNSSLLLYPKSNVVGVVSVFDSLGLQLLGDIEAHNHRLAHISIASTGNLAATASARGTIIRVFSLPDMQKMFTFRRGQNTAYIYDMTFLPSLPLLVTTSNRGTVHLFLLDQYPLPRNIGDTTQSWSAYFLTKVLPQDIIDSTRSYMSFALSHRHFNIATYVPGRVLSYSYAGGDQEFAVELLGKAA